MTTLFIIEDEGHAEWLPHEFNTFEDALDEVHRLVAIPWDSEPNRAPCTNWQSCGRNWVILQFDNSTLPHWTELTRTAVAEVRKGATRWFYRP